MTSHTACIASCPDAIHAVEEIYYIIFINGERYNQSEIFI